VPEGMTAEEYLEQNRRQAGLLDDPHEVGFKESIEPITIQIHWTVPLPSGTTIKLQDEEDAKALSVFLSANFRTDEEIERAAANYLAAMQQEYIKEHPGAVLRPLPDDERRSLMYGEWLAETKDDEPF
jgi:hypothetical protein